MRRGMLLAALLAALVRSAASQDEAWAPELGHAYAPALAQAPAQLPRVAPWFDWTTVPDSTMRPQFPPPLVTHGRARLNETWRLIDAPQGGTTCQINMLPYLQWSVAHPQDSQDPTVSPVPSSVNGTVQLLVYNNAGYAITPPWTLRMLVPAKTNVTSFANADTIDLDTSEKRKRWSAYIITGTDLLLPYSANSANISINLTGAEQDFIPRRVRVNGKHCRLQLLQATSPSRPLVPTPVNATDDAGWSSDTENSTLPVEVPGAASPESAPLLPLEPAVAAAPAPEAAAAPAAALPQPAVMEAEQPVSAVDGQLVGVDGKPLSIRGVNWFGFETSSTFVDGLWQGPSALSEDFGTIAYRMQLLGFNTVRLPMSFQVLYNMATRSFTQSCQAVSVASIAASTVRPGDAVSSGKQPPTQVAPAGTVCAAAGVCNEQVPNNSVYARFLWVVRFLTHNGFHVVIDNHLAVDNTALANPQQWAALWAQLLTDVVADAMSKNRVMIDILNEPDARGIEWTGSSPDATTLYLMAMDALHQVSPTTLLLVEGSGQLGYAMNWGDGFVTDRTKIAAYGLADANVFFGALLSKPYLNNVVISPHYYPPSVSRQQSGYTGSALWSRMTNSFGYLNKLGYAGHLFPIVIGETGSFYTSAQAADISMLTDMAKYMNLAGGADDGVHAPITNVIWWCWNANSGDTGGIVDNDWLTIMWAKVAWLQSAVGLTPWYQAGAAPPPPPPATPPPTPTTTRAPTTTPKATPTPTTTKAPTTTPKATPAPPAGAACLAYLATGQPWAVGGGQYSVSMTLTLSATGGAAINTPYQLSVANPAYTAVSGAWNWVFSGMTGGLAQGSVTQAWEGLQARSANSVSVGATFSGTSQSLRPTAVSVNGVACALSK